MLEIFMSDSVENVRKMPECSKSACLLLSIDHTACPLTLAPIGLRSPISSCFSVCFSSSSVLLFQPDFLGRHSRSHGSEEGNQYSCFVWERVPRFLRNDDAILVVPSALHPLGPKDPGYEVSIQRKRYWF